MLEKLLALQVPFLNGLLSLSELITFFLDRLPQRNTPAVVDKRQRSEDLQQDRGIEDCYRRL